MHHNLNIFQIRTSLQDGIHCIITVPVRVSYKKERKKNEYIKTTHFPLLVSICINTIFGRKCIINVLQNKRLIVGHGSNMNVTNSVSITIANENDTEGFVVNDPFHISVKQHV